ncbi:hypothetical protein PHYSODRAFT_247100 [Phytophthora sojae]|uniref:Chloride channel protein n=1 Tax=Phytophthora sojae (strain P6497) TaxID=1094619 RepID=G5A3Z1_PHYSP|nr:hypothetical protein PHYSODRAFT_247100 [Phytophthora sojae]EGZ10251.1 hypothetical protein PHYSODRAFT_247100 [Phytophthora sojae]|eukprot:XP_009535112.1 hypothetical protein PHYSODRAFT_247100 [Phytophthora sojae]
MREEEAKKASFRSEWTSCVSKKPAGWRAQCLEILHKEGRLTLLLVMLGISASLVDDIIDMVVLGLNRTRRELLKLAGSSDAPYAELAVWGAFTIVVATASVKWTAVFDPMAAGSGIPEMKSIISYERREDASRSLRARTLVSKIGGLALALGSGVSLGKEGPFVHTSSIIVHRLMKHLKCFLRIYDNDFMRRHMYDVACAVGVTTTFRAPIGGALFAIEVTSTVFMVSNYWRAFVASISALLARQAVYMAHQDWVAAHHAMFATNFASESFAFAEIVAFAVLAVLTGFLGALFASAATAFRLRWKAWAAGKSAVLASWTILFPLAAILCLPVGMTRLTFGDILGDLTSSESKLPNRWHADLSTSVFIVLPLSGLIRLVVTAMSFSLPVPTGDFIPTFIAGATFGRFFGEVLRLAFPAAGIVPGGYALAGGAGFVASTTNTTSVAVMALEFTGQFVYTIPLILSTLIASSVGCALRVSVYDSVIAKKGFSHVRTLELQDLKARDVMLRRFPAVTLEMVRAELECVLKATATTTTSLPVVENLDSMMFVGCIRCKGIEKFIRMSSDAENGSSLQLRTALQLPEQDDATIPATKQPSEKDDGMLAASEARQPERASAVEEVNSTSATSIASADNSPLVASDHLTTAEEAISGSLGLVIDSTALQVDPDTSLQKVHLLFEMIKCSSIWVTRRGKLVGLLHRQNLHARIAELKRRDAL